MRHKEEKLFNEIFSYYNKIIEQTPEFLTKLKKKAIDCAYLFDLNEVIKENSESLFTNFWIHCNKRGNEIVAQEVFKILSNKE
ncbi:hypothetical protein [Helicobacter canadensis]|uniref:Uncharacterized protein n=2 Tax=Helicobacter canadensis TaxID=123841 RepID=C5ZZB8_9HELI|nr:hypothetical protein [Helicobacter canadensis]EES89376.1 hypothetical protein HCAN_0661 [Helicobacter canadensis MIT 98-5491]EFR48165.1 hypothetical protein HCMG_00338 [Helicobacter canadensis MIT 98-5491]STO99411.1 Uncharacterised protein [Helicobacter canadensis]